MDKKYAVVGCGWLGLPIAEKWVNENKKVYGTTTTDNKIKTIEDKGIEAHILEDGMVESNKEWLKKVDYLLLCIPPSNLKENYSNFLLKIVEQLNKDAKIVMISSTSVYGDNNTEVNEESPLDGTGRNSRYVIEAEQKLKAYAKKNVSVIRMSGLVGADRNPAKYMQGRTISGGNEPVNLIHLSDCIGIIEHVIKDNIWGETLNGSAPSHPSKKEYYTYAAEQLGIQPPLFDLEKQNSKSVSSNKLIDKYGYNFIFSDPFLFPLK